MSEKRRDSKGQILRTGASQRKDGRYAYQYTDAYGKPQFVYSWRLVATDKTPAGSGMISRPGKRWRKSSGTLTMALTPPGRK